MGLIEAAFAQACRMQRQGKDGIRAGRHAGSQCIGQEIGEDQVCVEFQ
jgi:hypothetical protein